MKQRACRSGWWLGVFLALVTLVDTAGIAHAGLLITEVLYNPADTDGGREWIEIFNPTASTIDLTNYRIGDEETSGGGEGMLLFPTGASIGPGAVAVIANDASVFHHIYGFTPDYAMHDLTKDTGWATGSVILANGGDEVLLLDPDHLIVDAVSWGSSTVALNPAAPAVAEGFSLERWPANRDRDSASDWRANDSPSPGQVALNPVPEPATCVLFALLMGIVGLRAIRQTGKCEM